jgi:NADH-quinone oxidoreductase subunit N
MTLTSILTALAPEWILLLGACVVLMLGVVGRSPGRFVATFALLTVAAALVASLLVDYPTGEVLPGLWLNPLTYFARLIALSIGLLILLVNWRQSADGEHGEYTAMILFSLLGVLLTASANDWVVLFFAIELVSVPTYVLIALSRDDPRASESAIKYFFLGALSAAILVFGLVFLYGASGTTTIHRLTGTTVTSALSIGIPFGSTTTIGLLLVFAGLAFKIAAVPFHVYAADVYEGAASPVTGLLGFVPKFAGFLALIKVLSAIGWSLPTELSWLIWIVAAATMTIGNTLALLQKNVKRMLAYSSVAHTGYMLVALLVGPVAGQGPMRDGVAALLFYIAVYGVMNLGAFALLGAFRIGQRDAETLDDIAGIARRAPAAALALSICVFSLMGFPPTAGFLAKVYIFSSAFSLPGSHPMQHALIVLAVIGVINSAIAAAYYLRIVATAYAGAEVDEPSPVGGASIRVGLVLCAVPLLILFAWPTALTRQARDATVVLRKSVHADAPRVTTAYPPPPQDVTGTSH